MSGYNVSRIQPGRDGKTESALHRLLANTRPVLLAFGLAILTPLHAGAQTKLVVAKVADDFALTIGEFGNSVGIFKKRGLDVEFPLITSAKMVQAMLSGSIDMSLASANTLVYAAKGAPIKGVSALDGPPKMLVLAVNKNSKIKTPDDLKGKTVAITNKGAQTDWAVSQLAASKGWDDASIARAALGTTAARVAAIRAGVADATVIDLTAALALEDRGEGNILMNFGDVITNYQNQMVFASDAAIKDKPEAIKQFLTGLLETLDYARAHPKETIAFTEQNMNVSHNVAQKVYDELVAKPGFFTVDGRFDKKALQAMSKDFFDSKHLAQEVDLTAYLDQSLLPPAK